MQQQINLYQPIFRKEAKLLSAKSMVQIVAVCLALLVVIAGYFQVEVHSLKRSEQRMAQQADSLRTQIEVLKAQAEGSELDSLNGRVAELKAAIVQRQGMLATMDIVANDGRDGFTSYLIGLSRQRIPGLWLTAVRLDGTAAGAEVSGMALEADLIPRYLDLLPQDAALQHWQFQDIEVVRNSDDPRYLSFTLRNGAGNQGGLL